MFHLTLGLCFRHKIDYIELNVIDTISVKSTVCREMHAWCRKVDQIMKSKKNTKTKQCEKAKVVKGAI